MDIGGTLPEPGMGARGLFILEVAGVRACGKAVVVGEGAELPGEGATA